MRGGRFLVWWMLGGLAILPLTLLIASFPAIFAWMGMGFIFWNGTETALTVMGIVGFFVMGSILGFSLGAIQEAVLRYHTGWGDDDWWKHSLKGGMIGSVGAIACIFLLEEAGMFVTFWPVIVPFVLAVGLMQTRILRRYVDHSRLWLLANLIAGVVLASILANPSWDGLARLIVGIVSYSAVTGGAMLWLLQSTLSRKATIA